jgi:TonB family protein
MKTIYKLSLLIAFILLSAGFVSAQSERENGVALYQQGDYAGAVKLLKQASKKDANDAQVLYYLGLAYLKQDKNKEAEKALKKALALKAQDTKIRVALAYVYFLRNNAREAQTEAQTALESDPDNAEAHYVIGAVNFRNGAYNTAYERVKKAIEINPRLAAAYLIKSQSLVSSIAMQNGAVIRPLGARGQMLREATEDLEKYINLSADDEEARFYRESLESLKFFSEYYNRPENQKPVKFDAADEPDNSRTPLKIISKPRAEYTDKARGLQVTGGIRLLVGFSADGTVKHILVIKSLDYGLDKNAVGAARAIKFEPATKDGKPISVVREIEYHFSIY